MPLSSFRFTHLQIVKAHARVVDTDDGSATMLVPLELTREVTEFEKQLFLNAGARAEDRRLMVKVGSVEEIQNEKVREWKDLVEQVSVASMEHERTVAALAQEKANRLRRANAAVEYLNFAD